MSHINLVNINSSNYKQCLLLHICLKKLENGFEDKNCLEDDKRLVTYVGYNYYSISGYFSYILRLTFFSKPSNIFNFKQAILLSFTIFNHFYLKSRFLYFHIFLDGGEEISRTVCPFCLKISENDMCSATSIEISIIYTQNKIMTVTLCKKYEY